MPPPDLPRSQNPLARLNWALAHLDHPDLTTRLAVEEDIRRLGPAAVPPLIELWHTEQALKMKAEWAKVRGRPSLLVWVLGAGLMLIVSGSIMETAPENALRTFNLVLVNALLIAVTAAVYSAVHLWEGRAERVTLAPGAEQAARALALLTSGECVAPLADTLVMDPGSGMVTVPPPIYAALTHTLPSLTVDAATRLTQPQIERLTHTLDIYLSLAHADFLVELVRALARCHMETAIPRVRTLAESAVASPSGHRVRDEARVALRLLTEHSAARKASETLLRPSSSPKDELLLRPASNAASEEHLLLRPSTSDGR